MNIPAIYHELKNKNIKNIKVVLSVGTLIATIIYIMVGIFGYVTWSLNKNEYENMNRSMIL
jgi:amino acid permease